MSTTAVTPGVAPVILKFVVAFVVVTELVKKLTVPPSGFAVTSILTPPEGIADLMVTVKGKLGPGAGDSTCPFARGRVSTIRFSSLGVVGPVPFWQLIDATRKARNPNRNK